MSGNRKAVGVVALLVCAGLLLAACGSGDETTTRQAPAVALSTAGHLAKLSDRVASDLDAGDTCNAAHAADDLRSAVEDADLPASMRPTVDAVAGRLVDQVNCPPPPPPPEPEKKKKKPKETDEHGDEHHGDEGFNPPGHEKHGGLVPPGQAKLKGGTE
jgi:hypothetical protein